MSPLTKCLVGNPLCFGDLCWVAYRLEWICGRWQALQELSMMFMCLLGYLSLHAHTMYYVHVVSARESHKRQSTVSAHANLWLVDVDKDPGMTQWTSASVTGYYPCLRPSHRLFVDQVDGCFWLRLYSTLRCQPPHRSQSKPSSRQMAFFSKDYLILHNSLFKSGSTHCPLSRLLAPAPRVFAIGGLHHALPFAIFWHLL